MSQWNGHLDTFLSGSRSASALTAVDFAVPFSPLMSTPPMAGFMTLRIRAFFISFCPTIAVNGKITSDKVIPRVP